MHSQMNFIKIYLVFLFFIFSFYHLYDQKDVKKNLHNSIQKVQSIGQDDNHLIDTTLLGLWGHDFSTGNCVLWIVVDSLYFVDSDTWYNYSVIGDTIIISYDTIDYLKANYRVENDSLILKNDDMSIRYGKCRNDSY